MSAERGRVSGGPSVTGPANPVVRARGRADISSISVWRAGTSRWEKIERVKPAWVARIGRWFRDRWR